MRMARIETRIGQVCAVPTQLYFIECGCSLRPIKIGIASNVKQRLKGLQNANPYPLRLLKSALNAADQETAFHDEYASDRLVGEWFARSDKLLAAIEAMEGLEYAEGDEPKVTPVYDDYDFGPVVLTPEAWARIEADPEYVWQDSDRALPLTAGEQS